MGNYTLLASAVNEDDEQAPISEPGEAEVLDSAGEQVYAAIPVPEGDSLKLPVPFAELPYLDVYDVVWTGTAGAEELDVETNFELVGCHAFPIADLKDHDPEAKLGRLSSAKLRAGRVLTEQFFEDCTCVSHTPRGHRYTARGDGSVHLVLPHLEIREIYTVKVDDVLLAATEYSFDVWGRLTGSEVWVSGSMVEVHYAHGYDSPTPTVRDAMLEFATERLQPSALPSRATGKSDGDGGFVRYSLANEDNPTGLPDVDEVIRKARRERPVFG